MLKRRSGGGHQEELLMGEEGKHYGVRSKGVKRLLWIMGLKWSRYC